MECKRCGDTIDLKWGNKTYCGQCLHDQILSGNDQYFSAHSDLDEDVDYSAYVPREYRTPFQEEY